MIFLYNVWSNYAPITSYITARLIFSAPTFTYLWLLIPFRSICLFIYFHSRSPQTPEFTYFDRTYIWKRPFRLYFGD